MLSILKSKYNLMPIQVKASFWFLICSFLQKGISVITTPIFTRLLTTSEYGQLNVFNSWLGIITIIVSMNLYAGVYTQGMIKFNEERKVFSSSLQGLSLTLVVIWTVIYIAFYQFWNKLLSLTTVQMMSLLLMIWTTATFNFWASEQRVYYKYKLLVLITLFVSITKPLVGIFLVTHFEDKVTARILGLVLVEVIAYTGCFVSQIIRGKRFYSYKFWKYSIFYNLPLIPHYLSQVVLNNSDRIMINKFVGSSAAGIYGLAYSLAMVMTLFNIALMNTLNPWIYQKIKDKEYKKIEPVAYISLSIIAFVNLFLIALAPEVVKIFAPSSYYKAVYCIPPVAMSVLFMFMYDLFAKYVDRMFRNLGKEQTRHMPTPDARLSEAGFAVEQALKSMIMEVAEGTRTDTYFEVDLAELGYDPSSITQDDIDVLPSILIFDCSYELYWFGCAWTIPMIYSGNLYFGFVVGMPFRPEESEEFSVDTAAITRANTAVANAQAIIEEAIANE